MLKFLSPQLFDLIPKTYGRTTKHTDRDYQISDRLYLRDALSYFRDSYLCGRFVSL